MRNGSYLCFSQQKKSVLYLLNKQLAVGCWLELCGCELHNCTPLLDMIYQKRSEETFYSIFLKLPNLIFLSRKPLQHKAFFSRHWQLRNLSHLLFRLCEVYSREFLQLITKVQEYSRITAVSFHRFHFVHCITPVAHFPPSSLLIHSLPV